MFETAKELVRQLNSPSDWAVVLGAGTIGLVADGVWNILAPPFFSPGVCGLTAASPALAAKRGYEAQLDHRRESARRKSLKWAAMKLSDDLRSQGERKAASDLDWAVQYEAKTSHDIIAAMKTARDFLSHDEGAQP